MTSIGKNYQTAIGRWAGLGPYYAMFPIDFTFEVIEKYSLPGQKVIDPFAGRASSVYAAAALGRSALGIEINPVGWLYGHVKLNPAQEQNVISRLYSLNTLANRMGQQEINQLPEFFSFCYAPRVLQFLLAARNNLNWKDSIVDATLMAIILVNLHGKREQSLSNQMRQGKAMAPEYSIHWWKERQMSPPDISPYNFIRDRIEWRYAKGRPRFTNVKLFRGDSIRVLNRIGRSNKRDTYDLLFTSPPYYAVTNYFVDQWLRFWMLGGPSHPTYRQAKWEKRFHSQSEYKNLLHKVFANSKPLLSRESIIYVRTDAREFTFQTTEQILRALFPEKQVTIIDRPLKSKTQTALFGDKSQKPGEKDIILQ